MYGEIVVVSASVIGMIIVMSRGLPAMKSIYTQDNVYRLFAYFISKKGEVRRRREKWREMNAVPFSQKPNCLQATPASRKSQPSSQIVPQFPPKQISSVPDICPSAGTLVVRLSRSAPCSHTGLGTGRGIIM